MSALITIALQCLITKGTHHSVAHAGGGFPEQAPPPPASAPHIRATLAHPTQSRCTQSRWRPAGPVARPPPDPGGCRECTHPHPILNSPAPHPISPVGSGPELGVSKVPQSPLNTRRRRGAGAFPGVQLTRHARAWHTAAMGHGLVHALRSPPAPGWDAPRGGPGLLHQAGGGASGPGRSPASGPGFGTGAGLVEWAGPCGRGLRTWQPISVSLSAGWGRRRRRSEMESKAKGPPHGGPAPRETRAFSASAKLLFVSSQARQTLEHYSCTAEKIGHVDITKDRTSTVEACVPLELAKNKSCLVSRETSVLTTGSCLASTEPSPEPMMTLCLSSIYEDLKMYQGEFKAMNAILLMDPTSEITLDKDMLTAIDALMQALNSKSETVPHQPSSEEPDLYRIRMQLCILLHAFRVRAVTIDRVMSYLSSS
ncbi:PREDICTED: interleukin-12 subunit alpha [Dipodomys ordii]|uniref:Interleukin-12 subunit alpha n=1 Tax=Dipodomys ordii TaxID=10020 RepID=A0A1S3F5R7_DIPOR|nr:PREDICTED: interleukin-12 subunit alpha [Dipodomys ordii]